MIMVNGRMLSIIECDNCEYSRSSEDDGQVFHEVCGICYKEDCPTPCKLVTICDECYREEQRPDIPIDPGESLFT